MATFNIKLKKKTFGNLKTKKKIPNFAISKLKFNIWQIFEKKQKKIHWWTISWSLMLLAYFWKKKSPHNLLSNLCNLGYFWKKKIIPTTSFPIFVMWSTFGKKILPTTYFPIFVIWSTFGKKILPTTFFLVSMMISFSKAMSSSSFKL